MDGIPDGKGAKQNLSSAALWDVKRREFRRAGRALHSSNRLFEHPGAALVTFENLGSDQGYALLYCTAGGGSLAQNKEYDMFCKVDHSLLRDWIVAAWLQQVLYAGIDSTIFRSCIIGSTFADHIRIAFRAYGIHVPACCAGLLRVYRVNRLLYVVVYVVERKN